MNFSPKPYRKHEPPPPQQQQPPSMTEQKDVHTSNHNLSEQFKRETDLIDLTKMPNDGDLFSADIDFMNNYLKSLPDYSKIEQAPYNPQPVRLREHPTPKPFYGAINDYNARNSHKPSIPQSPKNHQRKQINPLSKSNSIHTFSKRNIGQSIEKETFSDEQQQKSKISRSTSTTTIPPKETSDLMGFMKKPSSLMNIFKKFGSQIPSTTQPKSPNIATNNNNLQRKNVHEINKTPSVSRTKNISDFWNENLQQQNTSNNKFGWNYQKIMAAQQQQQQQQQQQKQQLNETPKQVPPLGLVVVKKLEPIEPAKPTISNLSKKMPSETNIHQQQPHSHLPHQQHYPKSQSISNFSKKMTESPKLQRSARAMKDLHGDLEQEQKLLKSSSNSHIYMNQDDPNYLRNLHKITKSLDNATNNMISNNKSSYKRSISNTSVPCYLGTSPQQSHPIFYPTTQPTVMMVHPSSAPISFYPPISYKPPQDFHVHQRSGSKSNIPLCYKYPLNKSSSNASMLTNYNGTAIGFYSVQDPLLWQAAPALHHINKSSSSSCIYAKTLSQPTHLSKNNDIFAKYKPIVSDDEESESEDDDTSKHSQLSKGSFSSINNKVPAPAPFKKQANNYPPFTKLQSTIPINGQLPSAFKSSNNSIDTAVKATAHSAVDGNNEQNTSDIYNVSRKNSRTSSSITISANNNSKPLPMTSSTPVLKNSCNQASSNIFYNFLNPMAATQTQSINQMHLQQQNESVGSYTPYTKYLTDRKFFDVAMSDGMNVSGVKPEQRRTSKIPTLAEQKPKPPACNLATEANATVVKLCDKNDDDESQATCNEPQASNTHKSNERTIEVDPKEILSAFDPFFIDDSEPQPSTSNKLHQLLTTVANEWNSGCDHAIATTPSTMMSNCKAYQGDRYGSTQYEVVKTNIFHHRFFCLNICLT